MKKRWILALVIAGFLVAAVLRAPVAVLWTWLVPQPPPELHLDGIDGTLSAGRIAGVSVRGRPVLREVEWTLHPTWLLLARVEADIAAGGDTVLRSRVSRAPLGRLRLSDLELLTSVRNLLGLTGQAVLPVDGQARLALDRLVLDDGWIVAATGAAEARGIAWALARDPVLLGDYTAALTTDDKGILVSIADDGGPLELSGDLRLRPDRTYDLQLRLRPRDEAGPPLQTLVRSLGPADVRGWHHIRQQGQAPGATPP